jgi:hypothetical protein
MDLFHGMIVGRTYANCEAGLAAGHSPGSPTSPAFQLPAPICLNAPMELHRIDYVLVYHIVVVIQGNMTV